ncbi:hypothetical protein ACLRDC_12565 [Gluconacetobacter sacchari]|uniref:hypothetical protein n=1 Tax=Gluconacetobacter sacchari TaxID=92759 RepID=UPI0039B69B8D
MSVSSVEEKTAVVRPMAGGSRVRGVAMTPAQIHAAHRSALRQAGRRLRGRSRPDEADAMARPGTPSPRPV